MPATTPISASEVELATVKYNEDGLVAAIVQDAATRDVLMMAWMNAETLHQSLTEGRTVCSSRSSTASAGVDGRSSDAIRWPRSRCATVSYTSKVSSIATSRVIEECSPRSTIFSWHIDRH